MFQWLKDNSQVLTLLAQCCTLGVWVLYAQLLLNNYKRQRQPRLIINRGAGKGVGALCLLSNMSAEPVFINQLTVILKTNRETLYADVTDIRESGQDDVDPDLVLGQAARRLTDGGRIVALSTSVIAKSFPGYGPYIASKAGVEGLVHVLANELRGRNITVNAVAPGPVGTELFFNGKSEQLIEQIAKQAPLERIGDPDEIAAAVAFLAGPDGAWINAQVIRVNGGFA